MVKKMFNRKSSIVIILTYITSLAFFPSIAVAYGLSMDWEKEIGGKMVERATAALPIAEGGFLLVGEKETEYMKGNGKKDVFVVKTNPSGDKMWEKYYGGYGDDIGTCVSPTLDGGFIIGGTSRSNWEDHRNAFVIKISSDGLLQWKRDYPPDDQEDSQNLTDDEIICIHEVNDGYVVLGNKKTTDHDGGDIFVIKTNSQGGVLWRKTLSSNVDEKAIDLLLMPDGGYFIVGSQFSSGNGYDVVLYKMNQQGTMEWSKSFGGIGWDIPSAVVQTKEGHYIISGKSSSRSDGVFGGYLAKIDSAGNLLWQRIFAPDEVTMITSVIPKKDGGFQTAGWIESEARYDLVIMETDSTGAIQSRATMHNDKWSSPFPLSPTGDSSYVIAGYSVEKPGWKYWIDKNEQAYIAKISVK
ncbi:hypothetical protein H1S01_10590 [Heliobacterium chlorum]|uniref:Uncharacterized protein n=1 Tax=Heliobacterium chlorum TaxID=2698 RepID=A0ABR7T4N5_HELCL|nr:hypothetical protein [Heliobacterium chlorum]MBC9784958.1 hypothetical protein [Heliobacterium chlorum]